MTKREVAWSATVSGAAVRSLALLYAVGGLACLVAAAAPMSPETPRGLLMTLAAVGFVTGGLLRILSRQVPAAVLHVVLAAGAVALCVLVHSAATTAGALVAAFDFPFFGFYAAYYLTRRAARRHVTIAAVLFTLAWFTRPGPTPAVAWAVVVTSLVVTSEVLGTLMVKLQRYAVTDDLTGLLNRHGLRVGLDREMARASRSGSPLALVVLDVDGLKQVNDILGHASGDRLLTDLADAWVGQLRKADLLARVGGDEFVLVLPDTTTEVARDVIDRLRRVDGPARGTRWSAGVASLRSGETADDLIDRADRRMYAAKRAGRDVEIGV